MVYLFLLFAGVLAGQSIDQQAKAILDQKCVSCHGSARMSDLDLRDSGTILKGGKRGAAVVPGNAEGSLLYKAVKREGELQMPPGKVPLTSAEIAVLRDWINAGARAQSTSATTAAASW